MQKIVKLSFPKKALVEACEVVLQVEGYSQEVPCSEMPDEWWENLPKPLSRKPFRMNFSETDWEAYIDYLPEVRIMDAKGLADCISDLQKDERLKSFHPENIDRAFRRSGQMTSVLNGFITPKRVQSMRRMR